MPGGPFANQSVRTPAKYLHLILCVSINGVAFVARVGAKRVKIRESEGRTKSRSKFLAC